MNILSKHLTTGILAIATTSIAIGSLVVTKSATAADLNGFTTPGDAACAIDPTCALPRGGVSDVMTVFAPNGSIFDQIFAFGNEQGNGNAYYFSNPLITLDTTQNPLYHSLLGDVEGYSDNFGISIVAIPGNPVLGFTSDPSQLAPISSVTFQEIKCTDNSCPWVPEPGSIFTIPYDATIFLSADLKAQGYTAQFRSDVNVPEPSSVMAIIGLGILGMSSALKRKI